MGDCAAPLCNYRAAHAVPQAPARSRLAKLSDFSATCQHKEEVLASGKAAFQQRSAIMMIGVLAEAGYLRVARQSGSNQSQCGALMRSHSGVQSTLVNSSRH